MENQEKITMELKLQFCDIHSYCKHLGGVSECKARDSVNNGGGFDE